MELTFGEFSSLLYIKAVCQFTLFIGCVTKTVVELINRFKIGWPAVVYTRADNWCKYTCSSDHILM